MGQRSVSGGRRTPSARACARLPILILDSDQGDTDKSYARARQVECYQRWCQRRRRVLANAWKLPSWAIFPGQAFLQDGPGTEEVSVQIPVAEDELQGAEELGRFSPLALEAEGFGEVERGQGEIEVEMRLGIEVHQLAEESLGGGQIPFAAGDAASRSSRRPDQKTSECFA